MYKTEVVTMTKKELNKLNPCCATCEYVGHIEEVGTWKYADCQIGIRTRSPFDAFVCPNWEINMDIDHSEDDDVVLEINRAILCYPAQMHDECTGCKKCHA